MNTNNYYQPSRPPRQQEHGVLGIIGMTIGIISLLLSCVAIGGFFGVIGLIISIIGITQKDKKSGMSIAGIALNALAIILMIIVLFIYVQNPVESKNVTHEIEAEASTSSKQKGISETESVPTESSEIIEEPQITETKKEFIASCEEISYKSLLRNPDEYVGKRLKITAEIQQILQGGWFDDNEYYRVQTDNDGYELYLDDEYFMYDFRVDDTTKLLTEDVIIIYAEFAGTETVTRALTSTKEDIPAIKAYYVEIIAE